MDSYGATVLFSGRILPFSPINEIRCAGCCGNFNKIELLYGDLLELVSRYCEQLPNVGYYVKENQSLTEDEVIESQIITFVLEGRDIDLRLFINPYSLVGNTGESFNSSIYVVANGGSIPLGEAQNFFSKIKNVADDLLDEFIKKYRDFYASADISCENNAFHISCIGSELVPEDQISYLFLDSEDKEIALAQLKNNELMRFVFADLNSLIGVSKKDNVYMTGNWGCFRHLYVVSKANLGVAAFLDTSSTEKIQEYVASLFPELF